jgi:endonuclease YncB( thermonuclease family)
VEFIPFMREIASFVAMTLLVTAVNAAARDEIEGPVSAEILRVIDGDTLLVEARPWPQQTMEVYVRIRGIDAPEMHSSCADVRRESTPVTPWKALHPDPPRSSLRRSQATSISVTSLQM